MNNVITFERLTKTLKLMTFVTLGLEVFGFLFLIFVFFITGGEFEEYVCTSNCGTLWENGEVKTKPEIFFLILGLIMVVMSLAALVFFGKFNSRIKACIDNYKTAEKEDFKNRNRIEEIIDDMQKLKITHLIEYSNLLKNLRKPSYEHVPTSNSEIDKYDRLIKLGELKQNGLITQDEYEKEKKSILS
jgi:predicted nucleic acid-binding Zn ribbon protein